MSKTVRVMLCDDSPTMRKLLQSTLNEDRRLEVVYAATHGRDALDSLDKYKPDVLVLDVEMPVMDGIETVTNVRKRDRQLPIVMFSSLTSSGAGATLEALTAGANEFATKPVASGGLRAAQDYVKRELIPKLLQWNSKAPMKAGSTLRKSSVVSVSEAREKRRNRRVDIVAIGASTGGPEALQAVISDLPRSLNTPIVIAQHMPPIFTASLAERLRARTRRNVQEAKHGQRLDPNTILITPGDYHLVVKFKQASFVAELNQGPKVHACRPAVDVLFESVAACNGAGALGVVLTGMGEDGVKGARAIREKGGHVFAQDQASSVVWGMPREVASAGLADQILPLNRIGFEIGRAASENGLQTSAATDQL